MYGLGVFLMVLMILLSYLLFAPFYFEVDSRDGLCRFRFHKVASVRLYLSESSLFADLRCTGWHKSIDLLAPGKKRKKAGGKSPRQGSRRPSFGKIWAVLRSFRVNKLSVRLDTGNMQLNGVLYPLFLWLHRQTRRDLGINFLNENEIIIEIENTVFRMLRVYIRS